MLRVDMFALTPLRSTDSMFELSSIFANTQSTNTQFDTAHHAKEIQLWQVTVTRSPPTLKESIAHAGSGTRKSTVMFDEWAVSTTGGSLPLWFLSSSFNAYWGEKSQH